MNDTIYVLFIMFGYALICVAAVGVVFMADALLFGLTGRSFIGFMDKIIK
jgi:hypothetical protein